MAIWLFLILLVLPIIEIALFIQVGGAIGLLPTLGLIVLSAVVGTVLARWQGLQTLDRLRRNLEAGRDPSGPLAHAALILVAGMLLAIPGFFTDFLGLLLLIPPVRAQVIRWGAARMTVQATSFAYARRAQAGPVPGDTIDAEYEILDERRGRSGWTRPH
jgi:UPF0716 protein FxsA